MSTEKVQFKAYMTPAFKKKTKERALELGLCASTYVNELIMWECRHNLLPQLREGGSIICNGKEKA